VIKSCYSGWPRDRPANLQYTQVYTNWHVYQAGCVTSVCWHMYVGNIEPNPTPCSWWVWIVSGAHTHHTERGHDTEHITVTKKVTDVWTKTLSGHFRPRSCALREPFLLDCTYYKPTPLKWLQHHSYGFELAYVLLNGANIDGQVHCAL